MRCWTFCYLIAQEGPLSELHHFCRWDWEEEARLERKESLCKYCSIKQKADEQLRSVTAFRSVAGATNRSALLMVDAGTLLHKGRSTLHTCRAAQLSQPLLLDGAHPVPEQQGWR